MRLLRRALLFAFLAWLVTALWCWRAYSPGAPTYAAESVREVELPHRLRNGPEHDRALARTGNPYVLEAETAEGALLYYGARHASDPEDPQIADIEARWEAFRPTVALCEGRSRGYFVGWPFQSLTGLSEAAWVHALARRDGVRLLSLEPSYASEVAALLADFLPERVALYFTMRVYWSEAGGVANEALALDLLGKRTAVEGLEGALTSVADIDRLWKRDFAEEEDWRVSTTEPPGSYLDAISTTSRVVRGMHMARTLIDLVHRGERVFAVVGSGHVIRQEWVLRRVLGQEPAFDQPE